MARWDDGDAGAMATSGFPEPSSTPDRPGLLLSYLDYYRTVIIAKIGGLGNDDLQRATVPSGWTPAGLVNHPGRPRAGALPRPVGSGFRDYMTVAEATRYPTEHFDLQSQQLNG
jgi:hypothetical protein